MSDYNEIKDNLIGIIMSARQSVCPTDVDDISEALTLIEQQQARIAELEQRQNELTATVERLRYRVDNLLFSNSELHREIADILTATPQQSLAERKAWIADLREILELRAELLSVKNKLAIMIDKHGEPDSWKCVVYDMEDAETKLRNKLIEMGWTPPKGN